MTPQAVVVGQIARDLVLRVDEVPEPGTSAGVRLRREMLGGKGANQAVGLAQLGVRVALLGVVGEDEEGENLLRQARRDGIDVGHVLRRGQSALIVDLVDQKGRWRHLEDIPASSLVGEDDVNDAAALLEAAPYVIVQLQQPPETAMAAVRRAKGAVVLDGVPDRALLPMTTILRADAHEAELLVGHSVTGAREAIEAARDLQKSGPRLVAIAVEGEGNAFVWEDGELFLPLDKVDVVDTTGGGDAFVAGLTAALLSGDDVEEAAHQAVRAAGRTVGHAGGRPELSRSSVREGRSARPRR